MDPPILLARIYTGSPLIGNFSSSRISAQLTDARRVHRGAVPAAPLVLLVVPHHLSEGSLGMRKPPTFVIALFSFLTCAVLVKQPAAQSSTSADTQDVVAADAQDAPAID